MWSGLILFETEKKEGEKMHIHWAILIEPGFLRLPLGFLDKEPEFFLLFLSLSRFVGILSSQIILRVFTSVDFYLACLVEYNHGSIFRLLPLVSLVTQIFLSPLLVIV